MDIDTYAKILSRQKQSMMPAMQEAIKEQARLHFICESKRTRFYELEDQYRDIFSKGVELFFERYPELHEKLPCREPKAKQILAIFEGEHKKCADAFEGFWEKTRIFKNGFQRSKKIQELLDKAIDVEWESKAWKKIDTYYQKISGKPIEGVINRNALIHGDYNSNTMDVSSRDAVKIMLMWVNLRLIADHFCNIEELYENRMTMIPYFCTLPDDLAIDIMNRM